MENLYIYTYIYIYILIFFLNFVAKLYGDKIKSPTRVPCFEIPKRSSSCAASANLCVEARDAGGGHVLLKAHDEPLKRWRTLGAQHTTPLDQH